jgi:hypothetical protein
MRVTWRVGLSVGSIRFAVDSDGSDQTWLPLPVRTARNALRHDKGMTAIARKAVPMGKDAAREVWSTTYPGNGGLTHALAGESHRHPRCPEADSHSARESTQARL